MKLFLLDFERPSADRQAALELDGLLISNPPDWDAVIKFVIRHRGRFWQIAKHSFRWYRLFQFKFLLKLSDGEFSVLLSLVKDMPIDLAMIVKITMGSVPINLNRKYGVRVSDGMLERARNMIADEINRYVSPKMPGTLSMYSEQALLDVGLPFGCMMEQELLTSFIMENFWRVIVLLESESYLAWQILDEELFGALPMRYKMHLLVTLLRRNANPVFFKFFCLLLRSSRTSQGLRAIMWRMMNSCTTFNSSMLSRDNVVGYDIGSHINPEMSDVMTSSYMVTRCYVGRYSSMFSSVMAVRQNFSGLDSAKDLEFLSGTGSWPLARFELDKRGIKLDDDKMFKIIENFTNLAYEMAYYEPKVFNALTGRCDTWRIVTFLINALDSAVPVSNEVVDLFLKKEKDRLVSYRDTYGNSIAKLLVYGDRWRDLVVNRYIDRYQDYDKNEQQNETSFRRFCINNGLLDLPNNDGVTVNDMQAETEESYKKQLEAERGGKDKNRR